MECIGTKGKKSQVASCTDGFRPVVFLIEPYEGNHRDGERIKDHNLD